MVLPWLSLEAAITIPWSSPFLRIFIIVPTWVDFMFTIPPTLETSPIPTKENFADLETKKLSADRMRYLMHGVGVYDESAGELVGTDVVTRERVFFSVFPFFFSEPVAFRRVYGLESYSRNSGESNHHRPVSDVKNAAIPTEPRGRLCGDKGTCSRWCQRCATHAAWKHWWKKQSQNHGCNEDLVAAESSAFHRRREPDEPNFLFSAWAIGTSWTFIFMIKCRIYRYRRRLALKEKQREWLWVFFPSNAFMASARSSNTFNCMLQTRVN